MNAQPERLLFLLDVDNTLLDNDQIERDLSAHLTKCSVGKRVTDTGAFWSSCEPSWDMPIFSVHYNVIAPNTFTTHTFSRCPHFLSITRSSTGCIPRRWTS